MKLFHQSTLKKQLKILRATQATVPIETQMILTLHLQVIYKKRHCVLKTQDMEAVDSQGEVEG